MLTQNPHFLKYSNIIAFILMLVVNGLAGSTALIGGKLTAQISDANPTLITPAGYVFSIWGIIYILLGIFVVYQALPSKQGSDFQKRISVLFIISSLANIIWLFLWQFEYLVASVGLMFLLLASLIMIYLRLDIGKTKVSMNERLAVHLPFSVYLGWITIATIANIASTLVSVNWDGAGIAPLTWTTLIVIVALLITLVVVATRKDIAYALVVIWALVGIGAKQIQNPEIVTLTQLSALIIAIFLVAVIVFTKLSRRKSGHLIKRRIG
jgi:translocator protein